MFGRHTQKPDALGERHRDNTEKALAVIVVVVVARTTAATKRFMMPGSVAVDVVRGVDDEDVIVEVVVIAASLTNMSCRRGV